MPPAEVSAGFSVPRSCLVEHFGRGKGARIPHGEAKRAAGITLSIRLILGTLVAFSVSVAGMFVSVPEVAIATPVLPNVAALEVVAEDEGVQVLAWSDTTEIEESVREYFSDIPVMVDVAYCESRFVHVDPQTGGVMRGWLNSKDLGVMQINERYHGEAALKMGLDLHVLEDNMAYARYLYDTQGLQPWSASRHCWSRRPIALR